VSNANLPIRSVKLKETMMEWLREQMSHGDEGYAGVGFAAAYGENTVIPVIIIKLGRERVVTDESNGLINYDFWERKKTFQSTKDIEVYADAVSALDEESKTIAEILVDKMQTEIHSPSQDKIRILKVFDNATIAPTVIRRFGKAGLHVTRVTFTVRVAAVLEKVREEVKEV